MATTSFTQSQYDALCASIAQGVYEVDYGNKRVIYRSLKEMLTLKALMAEELGITKPNGGQFYGEHSKGLL